MNTNETKNGNGRIATPQLTLYHPKSNGTGAAIQFELRPAHGMADGAIFCRIAPQMTIGDAADNTPRFHTFDWDKNITVKFAFTDVCKILQVLRGECETVDDGNGLYHRSTTKSISIKFEHIIDPIPCYRMTFVQNDRTNNEETRAVISFSPAEGLGLCEVFAASLKEIAFGTSFESTSIAIARDEEMERNSSELAANEAKNEREEAESNAKNKAIAKVSAVAILCYVYGKEYSERISNAVDIACGDYIYDETLHLSDEYRKLGMDALGEDHPIWKFVK